MTQLAATARACAVVCTAPRSPQVPVEQLRGPPVRVIVCGRPFVNSWKRTNLCAVRIGSPLFGGRSYRGGRVRVYGCIPGCLVASLVVSLLLTVAINLLIRLF